MRPLLLLLLPLLPTACSRPGAPVPAPRPTPPLALAAVSGAEGALCVFSREVDSAPLFAIRADRRRLVGVARPEGGEPVVLAAKVKDEPIRPTRGAQLEGAGLSVAVAPAALPGVPVGADGVRRAAVLTAATPDGGSVEIDGVWICAGR